MDTNLDIVFDSEAILSKCGTYNSKFTRIWAGPYSPYSHFGEYDAARLHRTNKRFRYRPESAVGRQTFTDSAASSSVLVPANDLVSDQ